MGVSVGVGGCVHECVCVCVHVCVCERERERECVYVSVWYVCVCVHACVRCVYVCVCMNIIGMNLKCKLF